MKKIFSVLLIIGVLLCMAACKNGNESANTNPVTDLQNSLPFEFKGDLPQITFTGNTVEKPYESLPELSIENARLYITVTGYEDVQFVVPMSLQERFEKIESSAQTETLYLNEVPEFSYTFPEKLTDDVLAEYTECEPKITSVQAEKAYTSADGAIYIFLGKSALGEKQYVYQLANAQGEDIAWIYYDAQTRKVTSVHEFTFDEEELMVKNAKCDRAFYYTDGQLTKILVTAEATKYSDTAKGGDAYHFETDKAEMTYFVTNGTIRKLSDCLFWSSYSVILQDSYDDVRQGFHSYYDKSGDLTGIRISKYATEEDKENSAATSYYYIVKEDAWYTESGDRVSDN